MRFLFLASREISYPRNDVLIRALRRMGDVDVLGWQDKGSILFRSLSLAMRSLRTLRFREYDLVFVGFYGHFLMLHLSLWCPSPIVFDAFISTYDTLCFDRKVFPPHSLMGRTAYWIDKHACERSTHTILDTQQHVNYFQDTFDLPRTLLTSLPVSCNEDIFYPRNEIQTNEKRVLFYSSYMPLHGVEMILQVASLLEGKEDIHFRLIGDGPGRAEAQRFVRGRGIQQVHFLPRIPLEDLPQEIASAEIILGGHFGESGKADRVVPGKVYQIMAMAKPMIAGDTSANRDLLLNEVSALLCPQSDPGKLAEAIQLLHHDQSLRDNLGAGARQRFLQVCSEEVVTQRLEEIIREALKTNILR